MSAITLGGVQDGFVGRFASASFAPEYLTYRGSSNTDGLYAVAADADGRAVAGGGYGGMMAPDLAAVKYSPDGSSIEWSDTWSLGFFGGTVTGVAVAANGSAVFAGGDNFDISIRGYGAPPAPVVSSVSDGTGASPSDGVTNDNTVVVTGTAYPLGVVSVYTSGPTVAPTLLGTASVDGSGNWSYTTAALPNGILQLTAYTTAGGQVSVPSAIQPVVIDTVPPEVELTVLGGEYGYDTTPALVVTASDLYGVPDDDVDIDIDLDGDGNFSDPGEAGYASGTLSGGTVTITGYTPLPVGQTLLLRANVIDLAGNPGTSIITQIVIIPTPSSGGPAAPTITGISTDSGASNSDEVTNDTTPTVSGTATAGALVTLYHQGPDDGGPVPVGTTTASGGGTWSITTSALGDATYAFTATATVLGETSPFSAAVPVTIDTTAPTVSITVASPTFSTTPAVAALAWDAVGFASGVSAYLDVDLNNDNDFGDLGETAYATATRGPGGTAFTGYTPLSVGTYRFRARVTDLAGNEGTSAAVTVPIVSPPPAPPAAPAITGISTDTGASNSDEVTNDATLTVSGTATAGATVTVYHQTAGGAPVSGGTTTASGGGTWSLALSALAEGSYALTATATVSSVTSEPSGAVPVTVDLTAPALTIAAPALTLSTAPVIAVVASDAVGFAAGANAELDVDLNGDWDFGDPGESGYASAAIGAGGAVVFTGYTALTAGATYRMRARATDARGNVWTTQYDELGRAWREIDPNGNDARTYFDATGRAAESADALGNRRSAVFDLAGNPIASVDERLNRTSTTFDALDRPETTRDPLGNVTTAIYDAVGNVVESIDARGYRTTAVFDELDRVVEGINAAGGRSTAVYDAVGNVVVSIDALGRRTTAVFDELDRATEWIDARGGRSTAVYDAVGNVVSTIDALGRRTTTVYDELNRAVANVDALDNRATSIYDAAGQVVAAIDARGNRTTATFDAVGNVVAMTDALGNVSTSVYDAVGNMTASVDPLGRVTTFGYDELNRAAAELLRPPSPPESQDKIEDTISDFKNIPGYKVRRLERDNLATYLGEGNGGIYYSVSVPDIKRKLILRSSDGSNFETITMVADTLSDKVLEEYFVDSGNEANLLSCANMALTFALHVVPGGTVAANLAFGDGTRADVLFAVAGDTGAILTLGGAKIYSAARAAQVANEARKGLGVTLAITGLNMQGTSIIYNGALLTRDLAKGETLSAARHGGVLVLQVVLTRYGAKKLVAEFRTTSSPDLPNLQTPPAAAKPATGAANEPITVRPSRDLQDADEAFGRSVHNAYTDPRNTKYTVDPSTTAADEAAGVLVKGSYVKNPSAKELPGLVNEHGKILDPANGKVANGKYMYVVDDSGVIIIGTRSGQRMPHPTLISGPDPQVAAAGMVEIRGGKIYAVDNASGHFKPGTASLRNAKAAFGKLDSRAFKNFQGYLDHSGKVILPP